MQWACGGGGCDEVGGDKLVDLGLGNSRSSQEGCMPWGRGGAHTGRDKRIAKGEAGGSTGSSAKPNHCFAHGSPFLPRLEAPEPVTVHSLLPHSVNSANIYRPERQLPTVHPVRDCRRLRASCSVTGRGQQRHADVTLRSPLARLPRWGNWVTRSCQAANIRRGVGTLGFPARAVRPQMPPDGAIGALKASVLAAVAPARRRMRLITWSGSGLRGEGCRDLVPAKGFRKVDTFPRPHMRGGEGPGVFASERMGTSLRSGRPSLGLEVGEGLRAGRESVNARPTGSVVRRQVSSQIGFRVPV